MVKTAKQLEQEREQQVQEQEEQAAAQMAEQARNSEEDTTASEESSSEEVDGVWNGLLDDEEEETASHDKDFQEEPENSVEEAASEEEVEEVGEEAETPAETEEAAETLSETEDKTAEEEEEPEIPTSDETPSEDTRTPEQVKKEIEEARTNARAKLAEQFKLTEEQEELLGSNPNEVLPQMAADLYLDIFDSMVQAMQAQVPVMIQQTMQQQEQKSANEKKFFKAWPQLANKDYLPTINRIADNYRAMHPNADPDEAVKEIGAQAWIALRLPLDELAEHAEKVGAQQPDKQDTASVTPIQKGRKPSGPGKAADVNLEKPQPKLNEYERLAEELLYEDDV